MTTRTRLLTALVAVAIFCIGYIIGVIVDFPRPDNKELAGTVGKAKKYQKTRITAGDVRLRSELIKDTVLLRNMVQGLVHFSLLTEEISTNINLSTIAFRAKGMGSLPEEEMQLRLLEDYSDFILNNNKALYGTIALLSGLYLNGELDQSLDLEQNLRDFSSYVSQLSEKSTLLASGITTLDQFLLNNEALKEHQESISQLKYIRDQLIIKGIQLGGLINSRETVSSLINCGLSSQDNLALLFGQKNLVAATAANVTNQANFNPDVIIKDINNANINTSFSANDKMYLTEAVIYYDQIWMRFIINSRADLGFLEAMESMPGIQLIALFGKQELNLILSKYDLSKVIGSQLFEGALSGSQIGYFFNINDLNFIAFSDDGFARAIGFVMSQNLGYSE